MATINGKVFTTSGSEKLGMSKIPVTICAASEPHPDLAAKTDGKGRFRLCGLAPGSYTLGAHGNEVDVVLDSDDASVECEIEIDDRRADGLVAAPASQAHDVPEPLVRATGTAGAEPPEQPEPETQGNPSPLIEAFGTDPHGRDEESAPTQETGILRTGLVYAALSLRLATGMRDRNKLTDIAYGVLYPDEELPFSTDDPDFDEKSAEWLRVRRDIVTPLLADRPQAQPATHALREFGLTLENMPDGPTHKVRRNGKNWALPEVIDAMRAIAAEWHRRHSDIQLLILDASKPEGGRMHPPHKSHAVGLDVDCQLRIGGKKLCMDRPGYDAWRPLWQDLCDIARQNGVLPINAIGFSDPRVTGVSHWPGHTCHVHLRFCAPPDKIDAIEAAVNALYADEQSSKRPRYRCRAAAFEAAPAALEDTLFEFFPHELDAATGGIESAAAEMSLVQRGLVYAAFGLAYARGIHEADALTDEGWNTIFPDADFPLRSWHDGFARKRRVWLEIREMADGFIAALPRRDPAAPMVPATCRNAGRSALQRLAREAEAAGAPDGFAIFAEAAAWTESRWNNCAINDSASEADAARRLFDGARSRGWFPHTPHGPEAYAFSGGLFGGMPATFLIAGGNRGPFINADPKLVTDPAASVVMLADFMVRVFRKYDARDFLAIRRAMAALRLVGDVEERRDRSVLVRERFETALRKAGVADPAGFMARRPSIGAYPGAGALWSHLKTVQTD